MGAGADWSVKMHVGGYMLFYGKTLATVASRLSLPSFGRRVGFSTRTCFQPSAQTAWTV